VVLGPQGGRLRHHKMEARGGRTLNFRDQTEECRIRELEHLPTSCHALAISHDGAFPGFGLDDCRLIYADDISRAVKWGDSTAVGKLAGQPVRLRFVRTRRTSTR